MRCGGFAVGSAGCCSRITFCGSLRLFTGIGDAGTGLDTDPPCSRTTDLSRLSSGTERRRTRSGGFRAGAMVLITGIVPNLSGLTLGGANSPVPLRNGFTPLTRPFLPLTNALRSTTFTAFFTCTFRKFRGRIRSPPAMLMFTLFGP